MKEVVWGKVRHKKKLFEQKSCKGTRKQSEFDVVHQRKCKIAYFSRKGKDFISLLRTIERGLVDNKHCREEISFDEAEEKNSFVRYLDKLDLKQETNCYWRIPLNPLSFIGFKYNQLQKWPIYSDRFEGPILYFPVLQVEEPGFWLVPHCLNSFARFSLC